MGPAPPEGVRGNGPRLPGPRLHERGTGLRHRRRQPLWRRGAQLRQPDHPRQVRHRGPEAEVAHPARRRRDGVGLLDDGTAQRRLRPAVAHDQRRARRRRVGDQRPQVVHIQRYRCRLLHRHGARRRLRRSRQGPPGNDGAVHRPDCDQGCEHRPRHRNLGPTDVRPLRGRLRRRAHPQGQHPRPGRAGPSGGPGPARRRAHLPLHELGRADVARST